MSDKKQALNSVDSETVLEFIDEDEEACFHASMLGQDAVDFFNSRLGKQIRVYAISEIKSAQQALVNVEASDINQIMKLQMQANVPALFLSFVQEAIQNGEQAYVELQQREAERIN